MFIGKVVVVALGAVYHQRKRGEHGPLSDIGSVDVCSLPLLGLWPYLLSQSSQRWARGVLYLYRTRQDAGRPNAEVRCWTLEEGPSNAYKALGARRSA